MSEETNDQPLAETKAVPARRRTARRKPAARSGAGTVKKPRSNGRHRAGEDESAEQSRTGGAAGETTESPIAESTPAVHDGAPASQTGGEETAGKALVPSPTPTIDSAEPAAEAKTPESLDQSRPATDHVAAYGASSSPPEAQPFRDHSRDLHSPRPPQPQQQHSQPQFRDHRDRDRNRDGDRNRDRGYDRDRFSGNQPASQSNAQYDEQFQREPELGEGVIEISGKGFGFLREAKRNFVQTPQDIFVTPEIVRRFSLRDGMWVQGETRRGNRGPQLTRLLKINGDEPTKYGNLPAFEELTTINPNRRIKLETVPDRYTTRIMDLMTPLGMGQRGIIVAPPRTGKTTLLQHIADAVVKNHPEMKLIILLVDERPEEVTEIRRTVPSAEVMASSNDSDIKSHTRIAQLAIERAKRLVEAGKDVFILLDSITRTARAFNNATGGGGRTMSGGIDARAMEIPRKLFSAARNTEEAGSLTIVATALIETGSRMDELIFQEFKGTGNMELVLDRKISDQRVYPAVDIFLSGTRREELLLQPWELEKINLIRRGLAGHKPGEAIERLLMFVKKFPTNEQMLKGIPG